MLPPVGAGGLQVCTATYFVPSVKFGLGYGGNIGPVNVVTFNNSQVMILARFGEESDGRLIEGMDRGQNTIFPECLEDWIGQDNPVRVIDAFVEQLDLAKLRWVMD